MTSIKKDIVKEINEIISSEAPGVGVAHAQSENPTTSNNHTTNTELFDAFRDLSALTPTSSFIKYVDSRRGSSDSNNSVPQTLSRANPTGSFVRRTNANRQSSTMSNDSIPWASENSFTTNSSSAFNIHSEYKDVNNFLELPEDMGIEYVILADADGCLLPINNEAREYFKIHDYKLSSSYNDDYMDLFNTSNETFFKEISARRQNILNFNPSYNSVLMSYSNRQSIAIDTENNRTKHNGSFIHAINILSQKLDVELDKTLLSDYFSNKTAGYTFDKVISEGHTFINDDYNKIDESKVINLYMAAHKRALKSPTKLIFLDIFDDKKQILENCYNFYKKHSNKLPLNTIIRFNIYENGEEPHCLTILQGTGSIDYNFSNTIQAMTATVTANLPIFNINNAFNYANILEKKNFFHKLKATPIIQNNWRRYCAKRKVELAQREHKKDISFNQTKQTLRL